MKPGRLFRVSAALGLFLSVLSPPRLAVAMGGTYLGESSRVAAVANAAAARPGDAGSIVVNPAGLGDVTRPHVVLGGHAARLDQRFARLGEPDEDRSRWLSGVGVAVATPLPGPAWLRRAVVGFAMTTPADAVLKVRVAERTDEPISPIYDGRPDRISTTLAGAYRVLDVLSFGAGLTLTPAFDVPTEVTYVAGRGGSPERDVVVRLERDLRIGVTPLFGVRAEPLPSLALAVVYRPASIVKAEGKNRTVAGGILADDPLDYAQFWDPDELTAGVVVRPTSALSVSADVTRARWAQFRSAFNQRVDPPFESTLTPRLGVEGRVSPLLVLRGGYAFEPTPVPEQRGEGNYLGADTHVLAGGAGFDFRPGAPLTLDAHARVHLGAEQRAEKDPARLRDTHPELPGKQLGNLGHPGFESRSLLFQAGLTLTLFLGRAP